jgi:hypothetical protein
VAHAAHLELANLFALTEDIGAVGLGHEDSSLGLTMQRRTETLAQIVPARRRRRRMVDAPSSAASAVSAGDSWLATLECTVSPREQIAFPRALPNLTEIGWPGWSASNLRAFCAPIPLPQTPTRPTNHATPTASPPGRCMRKSAFPR